MGIIKVEHHEFYYEFEKSDEETEYVLRILTGAKVIKAKNECSFKTEKIEELKATPNKPALKNEENTKWYSPTSEEIKKFIRSSPDYRHTTRDILAYYNEGVDITLAGKDEENRKVWYNVLQKLRPIHKMIEQNEKGEWIKERVGQGKEYIFKKY